MKKYASVRPFWYGGPLVPRMLFLI